MGKAHTGTVQKLPKGQIPAAAGQAWRPHERFLVRPRETCGHSRGAGHGELLAHPWPRRIQPRSASEPVHLTPPLLPQEHRSLQTRPPTARPLALAGFGQAGGHLPTLHASTDALGLPCRRPVCLIPQLPQSRGAGGVRREQVAVPISKLASSWSPTGGIRPETAVGEATGAGQALRPRPAATVAPGNVWQWVGCLPGAPSGPHAASPHTLFRPARGPAQARAGGGAFSCSSAPASFCARLGPCVAGCTRGRRVPC